MATRTQDITFVIPSQVQQAELAGATRSLVEDFEDLKLRVPAPWLWDSVHTQARFTLEPYQTVAGAAEKRAVVELLKLLQAMAAT
jgi:hypothetical protein